MIYTRSRQKFKIRVIDLMEVGLKMQLKLISFCRCKGFYILDPFEFLILDSLYPNV
jgi:hypothetical protein